MTAATIGTPHGTLPVHVARPPGAGPWPPVVIIHDAGGVSKDIRHRAEWLAAAGYLAVAPDPFCGGSLPAVVTPGVRRGRRTAGWTGRARGLTGPAGRGT